MVRSRERLLQMMLGLMLLSTSSLAASKNPSRANHCILALSNNWDAEAALASPELEQIVRGIRAEGKIPLYRAVGENWADHYTDETLARHTAWYGPQYGRNASVSPAYSLNEFQQGKSYVAGEPVWLIVFAWDGRHPTWSENGMKTLLPIEDMDVRARLKIKDPERFLEREEEEEVPALPPLKDPLDIMTVMVRPELENTIAAIRAEHRIPLYRVVRGDEVGQYSREGLRRDLDKYGANYQRVVSLDFSQALESAMKNFGRSGDRTPWVVVFAWNGQNPQWVERPGVPSGIELSLGINEMDVRERISIAGPPTQVPNTGIRDAMAILPYTKEIQ